MFPWWSPAIKESPEPSKATFKNRRTFGWYSEVLWTMFTIILPKHINLNVTFTITHQLLHVGFYWGLPACLRFLLLSLLFPRVHHLKTSKQFRKPLIMREASIHLFINYSKTFCQNWRNETLGMTDRQGSCPPVIYRHIQTVCVMVNRQQGLRVCLCNTKCSKMS